MKNLNLKPALVIASITFLQAAAWSQPIICEKIYDPNRPQTLFQRVATPLKLFSARVGMARITDGDLKSMADQVRQGTSEAQQTARLDSYISSLKSALKPNDLLKLIELTSPTEPSAHVIQDYISTRRRDINVDKFVEIISSISTLRTSATLLAENLYTFDSISNNFLFTELLSRVAAVKTESERIETVQDVFSALRRHNFATVDARKMLALLKMIPSSIIAESHLTTPARDLFVIDYLRVLIPQQFEPILTGEFGERILKTKSPTGVDVPRLKAQDVRTVKEAVVSEETKGRLDRIIKDLQTTEAYRGGGMG